MNRQIIVFYRNYPTELDSYIRSDGFMTLVRDGVHPIGTIKKSAPRLTILTKSLSPARDPDRIRGLFNLLDELVARGQILLYREGGL